MTHLDPHQLAERYVAVWNEPDAAARRAQVAELWAGDGVHYVGTREARGYAQLEERVTGSHDKNVRDAGYIFRVGGNVRALRDVVTFNWEMVRPGTDEVVAIGLEFLQVDADGQIASDYQFIVG